jgi:hypothetical protein
MDDAQTAIDQLVAKQIYQESIGSLDAAGQLNLARQLGILSEADYQVAAAVQAQSDAYQSGQEDQGTYLLQVQAINDAVDWARENNQPITQDFIHNYYENHYVKTTYSVGGVAVPSNAMSRNEAGGPVSSGNVLWNEGGKPEVLVTGSGGMIISHDEAVKTLGAVGGGGSNAAMVAAINGLPARLSALLGQVVANAVRDVLQYNRSISR